MIFSALFGTTNFLLFPMVRDAVEAFNTIVVRTAMANLMILHK